MVWPFTSGKSEDAEATKGDPYRDLNPSLRKFLEREAPVKYNPPDPQPPPPTKASESPAVKDPSHNQSQFPDGRYSHLWSTYRPLREIEDENKTDQEKLMDVLNAYKDRKEAIGRAALENCADVHLVLNQCYRTGTWGQRFNLCRNEVRALDRCYKMNAQFLKALGYLSAWDRPPEIDEQIQMHADKLYTRMLDQEKQIEEAKAANLEPPKFPPILSHAKNSTAASKGESSHQTMAGAISPRPPELDMLTDKAKAKLEQRTKDMTPEQRDIEERAFAAELRAGIQAQGSLDRHRAEVATAKQERKEKGQMTLADRVSSLFGW